MKHFCRFLLVFLLVALTLFATLFLEISFGESPQFSAGYCPTHGLLAVKAVLPESVGALWEALSHVTDPLPRALREPPRAVGRAVFSLLRDVREIYRAETAGCTALS